MQDDTSFGRWLQQRRRALDLTQADLAKQPGVASNTIHKIETDARRPSKQVAQQLTRLLAIPVEEQAAFIRFARGETSRIQPSLHSLCSHRFLFHCCPIAPGPVLFQLGGISSLPQVRAYSSTPRMAHGPTRWDSGQDSLARRYMLGRSAPILASVTVRQQQGHRRGLVEYNTYCYLHSVVVSAPFRSENLHISRRALV